VRVLTVGDIRLTPRPTFWISSRLQRDWRFYCKWKIFLAESMFEQPALDYREFPHFEVRNSLEAQTEQCAARLQRHNIDLDGWTFNL
jgi:hypothetical protein